MKLSELGNLVENLNGVGPSTAKRFARLNIFTVADLLSTWPKSYEDRTERIPLSEYLSGKVNTICKVTAQDWFGYGKMRTLKLAITDGTANAWLIAFNRPFLEKSLPEGSIVAVRGKFDVKYNSLQSTAFEAERISYAGELEDYSVKTLPDAKVLPVYPLTEGLSQKIFRKTVAAALSLYAKSIDDEIPQNIISERNLLHKAEAVHDVHIPATLLAAQKARHTLIYEELYNFEYKMAVRTLEHRGHLPSFEQVSAFEKTSPAKEETIRSAAPEFSVPPISEECFVATLSPTQKKLHARLPFSLTEGQKNSIMEMNRDIDRSQEEFAKMLTKAEELTHNPFSMQRLLQGDVGSGKTLVAFFLCLRVKDYGGQCALMAPTELLALQHAENAARLLEPLGIKVAFLTGNLKAAGRNNLLSALKEGEIDIAVGTHALFSQSVRYKALQLAIIDEQHRFGVTQRESIIAKGRIQSANGKFSHSPDVLMMSATPIPQTLALTAFGDLDISVIRFLPSGRRPIKTYLSVMGHESNVYEAVRKELEAGRQAYFVYPRIAEGDGEESEENSGELKSAEEMFSFLSKKIYPRYSCALVHGKIEEEKQHAILEDFRKGKTQILVATTVVEVGVDVPNATCIVIEHADRFGLAALHQLRGRVGRGSLQSYCFLIYSRNITEDGIKRLKVLRQNTDGFVIAEEDLEIRGPGEIAGTAQSGYLSLSIADIARDKDILIQARYDAFLTLSTRNESKQK